ncbi:iron uptake transporter permease EfeU [Yinghuangia soli]|uniref:FTR1 family protein n=1 Tax=Yinghuangia soli TaxID=2908204 RepID=A0AA41PUT9_9ACTN|nr:iron uptake transporter permease EfeU [Yinghuangia soli]MCF2526264.1 FTR1 family protein [Yinghuangia soli]
MFANYLIGLREGLEAALVVSILVAYLVKSGRSDRLPPVWGGVAVAVALSLGFGAFLEFTSAEMTFEQQELFGGTLSIVAVVLVTWMVFWMRKTARHLKAELHGKLDAALAMGTGALVLTAFLAVGREGLETALFVWTAVRATEDGTDPLIGVALGIATAVVFAYFFYKGAVRLNLARFFTWTGGALIVVAAGVLAYGVHDLQEAEFLPGLNDRAFDVSETIEPASWYGTLLKGVFNFQPNPSVAQCIVWTAYLVPVMAIFLFHKPKGGAAAAAPPSSSSTSSTSSAAPAAGGQANSALPQ